MSHLTKVNGKLRLAIEDKEAGNIKVTILKQFKLNLRNLGSIRHILFKDL